VTVPLEGDHIADVAILGGGIAGMATAYMLLRTTDRRVAVVEGGLVGHGATGHNGGQAVAAFEERLTDLVTAFGEERTARAFLEVESSGSILEEMAARVGLSDGVIRTTEVVGVRSRPEVQRWDREMEARDRIGLPGRMVVAEDIDHHGRGTVIPRASVNEILWSKDHRYSAAIEMPVRTLNSYALTEALTKYLMRAFPDRCGVFERSSVDRIIIERGTAVLRSGSAKLEAPSVVLCTNGYSWPEIKAPNRPAVPPPQGVMGYMVGKLSPEGMDGARAYYNNGDMYYYLTQRATRHGWLTAVGGPEASVERAQGAITSQDAYQQIEGFLATTVDRHLGDTRYRWKGLMGYTDSGVWVAGQDPRIEPLHYNLGCNGIGLLPAVAGAVQIARLIRGEDNVPSMFDPTTGSKRMVQRAR
jgi:glycine/D-amino acid oxidase-like deaminating enzyme